MNRLKGVIETIEENEGISLVTVRVMSSLLSAIVIDTPETAPYLRIGRPVYVVFKETEVSIGKGMHHAVSLQNKLPASIQSIITGTLLSKIILQTEADIITSLITTNAVHELQLKDGDEVVAMMKTNEIMLQE